MKLIKQSLKISFLIRDPTINLLKYLYNGKNGLFRFLKERGIKNISEINLFILNEYKNHLISLRELKQLEGSSVVNYLEYSRVFLNYCVKLDFIENFFGNFKLPFFPQTSLMKKKRYELENIIEVINAYFDEYLKEKSKVTSRLGEFVRGIKPNVLKQFLAYLMTVSFVCRRKEPLDIELNNIITKEVLLEQNNIAPEAAEFLNFNDRVVIYIKKSKKNSKNQLIGKLHSSNFRRFT